MEPFNVLMMFVAMVGVIGAAGVALTLLLEDRRLDAVYDKDAESINLYRSFGGE